MVQKYILPGVAVLLVIFAIGFALYVQRPEPNPPPPVSPSVSPFGQTVAGAGMVEPSTESSVNGYISVGTQLGGLITNVHIHIGQEVKKGQLLFELDKRQTEADLQVRQAAQENAEANLRRLERQPWEMQVPPSEAQVRYAEAVLKEQKDVRDRNLKMPPGTISPQEMVASELVYRSARAQLAVAQTNLALLKAGAWDADKLIAYTAVKQARAQVEQDKTTLDILQVRAPVDGTLLQVNVRPGEYVAPVPGQALIMMGSLKPLHVRVNIDEEDIPRLRLGAPARAKLRGDARQEEIPMTFVRLEPYVIPKTSLTGMNIERVDTRVAQLVYAIDPENKLVREKKVLVGQLLDVFIDTRCPSSDSK
ncbi:MAG TPA: efflux RND transporter periplasmic adaptor subunit [Gemmataceae bacterium]|jgi:multidrug resistance efflux pump